MQQREYAKNGFVRGLNYVLSAWLIIVLSVVCSALLIFLSLSLRDRIARNKLLFATDQIKKLVPTVTSVKEETIAEKEVFRTQDKDGKLMGWAVKAQGKAWGEIEILIVLNPEAEMLLGIGVLTADRETPGLGSHIKSDDFCKRFVSTEVKPMRTGKLFVASKLEPKENEIKALTGATISSRGVCDTINDALTPKLIAALKQASAHASVQKETPK